MVGNQLIIHWWIFHSDIIFLSCTAALKFPLPIFNVFHFSRPYFPLHTWAYLQCCFKAHVSYFIHFHNFWVSFYWLLFRFTIPCSSVGHDFYWVGLPMWHWGEESACPCRRLEKSGFDPGVGKIPWSRKWQLAPVILPGKFHGQREPGGLSPWGPKESTTTELTAYTQTL